MATSELHVTPVGPGPHGRMLWRTQSEFWWRQGRLGGPYGAGITIPAGRTTDFASVPRLFWRVVPPDICPEAAVPHDEMYHRRLCSRWMADAIFYEILREKGVPAWKSLVMWLAVRLFGPRFKKRIEVEANHAPPSRIMPAV